MNDKNYIDAEKLSITMKEVWEIASAHGWHDKPISKEQYLGLIMTEMSEAVEADRNNRRAESDEFDKLLNSYPKTTTSDIFRDWFYTSYKNYIKGSIEEEFADIVIRLLDMAQGIHGEEMSWGGYYPYGQVFRENASFIENAWFFIRDVLNCGTMNISDSISFIFDWAQHLNIDLWKHIEWKMKYNELRPYKHGNKKY